IFYELLTGDQVHGNRTPAQLARLRATSVEGLDLLPATDRPIVDRALDPDPDNRFPSCADFVQALLENTPDGQPVAQRQGRIGGLESLLSGPTRELLLPTPEAVHLITTLVSSLAAEHEVQEYHSIPSCYRENELIEHRCYAQLLPGTLRLKLVGFSDQWHLSLVEEADERFLFHLRLQSSLWQRVLGQTPALAIEVRLNSPHGFE